MKIQEFIDKLMEYKSTEIRKNFIKNRVVNKYIPFWKKASLAKIIVENSYIDKNGNYNPCTPMTYVFWVLNCVKEYTDIEIELGTDNLSNYDLLQRYHLVDILYGIIAEATENDIEEFKKIVKMTEADFREKNNSIPNYLDKKINDIISTSIAIAQENIENKVE